MLPAFDLNQLEFRNFSPAEADALWSLHTQFLEADEPLEDWRQRVSSPPAEQLKQVFQTAHLGAQVLGYIRISEINSDVLDVRLAVRDEWRGQGIGSRFWDHLRFEAQRFSASRWQTTLRNPSATARLFLDKRGFALLQHTIHSHLSLPATIDIGLISQLEEQGYRFCPLQVAGDTSVNREKLYRLVREAVMDDPGFEGEFETLEQFEQLANAWYWDEADTRYLAIHGDEWVALSGLHPKPDQPFIDSGLTGVTKNHRGRGLAQAVKAMAITDALKRGYKEIRTSNDSRNADMLAVNRKLGFKAISEFAWFERKNSAV